MTELFTHGYALLVGVGAVAFPSWSLPVTVKDVQALRNILIDPNLCAYPDDIQHIRLLHNMEATRQTIIDGLSWLKEQATTDAEATVIVYYSGHGWLNQATGDYYLITHDIKPYNIAGSALQAQVFAAALRAIPARRLLVFIDACHAEEIATKDSPRIELPPGFIDTALAKNIISDLKRGEGRAIFTSSRGEQRSWVRPDRTLSIYTYHLIEALQGAGNKPGDTVVRVSNLMNHLGQMVNESAQSFHSATQIPFFDTATEDFVVAILRGGKGMPVGGWQEVQKEATETIRRVTTASGTRNVSIGGNVDKSIIITGNQNRIK